VLYGLKLKTRQTSNSLQIIVKEFDYRSSLTTTTKKTGIWNISDRS